MPKNFPQMSAQSSLTICEPTARRFGALTLLPMMACVLGAAALLSLTACAAQNTGATTPAGNFPHTSKWDQKTWVVTALGGSDLPTDGPRPTLSIKDGVAFGTDGCNRYRRALKPASDVPSALRFDEAGAASTRMACPGPADAVSRDWNTALNATRSVRTEPTRLTFIDQSGNVIARLAPAPDEATNR
ncbi:Heat shock protein HslJ [Roseateles sp. YR242]|uniref:META domain-containing protein n=1 Tax=Roseateles sp. YR242 TaxID=1855305 RepID=UPI0008C93775|nr:META domain-containing protein [Roseateles sp. YR242]SEL17138.1 Heat shock protein HslJ [Roseateles sp. YR242]